MNIGSLSRRFWAYCFDITIVLGIYAGALIALRMLGVNIHLQEVLGKNPTYLLIFYLTYGTLLIAYEVGFIGSPLSATPGKLILGLEVCCDNEKRFSKVVIRALIKVIAAVTGIINTVSSCFVLFSHERKAIHDLIAGTVVVKKDIPLPSRDNHMIIFDEMKKRGLTSYSEQLALKEELDSINKKSKNSSYAWVGVIILFLSILLNLSFVKLNLPDLSTYVRKAAVASSYKYMDNYVSVDESTAAKYVGLWSTSDNKVGFRVFYKNSNMYISTSQRSLKFRFDSNKVLFVTDGNNNEYKIGIVNADNLLMTRPIDSKLEIRYSLSRVKE